MQCLPIMDLHVRTQQSFVYSRDKVKTISLGNGHEVYISK